MAGELLSIDDVCKELQLSKEQVTALVKQGALRGFLDQKTYKFRREDLEKYKQAAESSATVVYEEGGPDGPASDSAVTEVESGSSIGGASDSTKVDLADIDSDLDVEESDQTSVMAPIEDQTSLMPAVGGRADGAGKEEDAVFEFSEDELGLSLDDEAPADSVLVADESESSLDILEVTEESSSESATSTADFEFMEESSSSEDVAAVAAVADETPPEVAGAEAPFDTVQAAEDTPPSSVGAAGAAGTAADLLGDEISDEELETLDIEDVVDTQETLLEDDQVGPGETATVEVGASMDDFPLDDGPATDTAETAPVGDESPTVAIAAEEPTQGLPGFEGAEPYEGEGYEERDEFGPAQVATAYELVTPSPVMNVLLLLSILVVAFGAVFLFTEATSEAPNAITDMFKTSIAPTILNILGGS